ncbi:MAG: hypothetical protein ACREOH_13610 [Candidatus Entotheonellia bacterium]
MAGQVLSAVARRQIPGTLPPGGGDPPGGPRLAGPAGVQCPSEVMQIPETKARALSWIVEPKDARSLAPCAGLQGALAKDTMAAGAVFHRHWPGARLAHQ